MGLHARVNERNVRLQPVLVGQGRIPFGAQTGHDVDKVLHGPTCTWSEKSENLCAVHGVHSVRCALKIVQAGYQVVGLILMAWMCFSRGGGRILEVKAQGHVRRVLFLGLARPMYIRRISGRKPTKYTVKYSVYLRFWPTLFMPYLLHVDNLVR